MIEDDDDMFDELPHEIDEDDEEGEALASSAPLPSLAQMEKDCAWAEAHIAQRLADDPDYPTDKLLAEVRSRVRPLTGYRATPSEWAGLGILAMKAKVSDRVRELKKEEEEKE